MTYKKRVLLYCQDETERSVAKFFLETRGGYEVMGAISPEPPVPDAVLVIDDHSLATPREAQGIARCMPAVPMLVHFAKQRHRNTLCADYPAIATILPLHCTNEELLRQIAIATTKKRGPKPKAA